jgi:hypothetical protein
MLNEFADDAVKAYDAVVAVSAFPFNDALIVERFSHFVVTAL